MVDDIFVFAAESTLETVVGGLRPDTQYFVQVAAYTRRGDGQRSRAKRIKTKPTRETALGPPRNVKLELAAPSDPPAVVLTWMAPGGGRGAEAGLTYRVEWGASEGLVGGEGHAETGETTYTATGLGNINCNTKM